MDSRIPGFDLKRAEQAVSHFVTATGISCRLLDDMGQELFRAGTLAEAGFCRLYREISGQEINCRQSHLYGGNQSLRFGGRYTFFCPLSLVHISSPVMADGVMRGSLIGGPLLLIDPEEYLADELGANRGISPDLLGKMAPAVRRIPYVDPERARSLGELLLYTASYISGVNVKEVVEEEIRISQQSRISEYIQDLKTMGAGDEKKAYPLEKEKKLVDYIALGDKKKAVGLLDELLGDLSLSSGYNFATIKARTLELVVILSRAAVEGGAQAEDVFGLNFRAIEEIHRFRTVPELNYWLSKMVGRFVSFVFDVRETQHKNVILKAMQFMDSHFADKLSLEDVARQVFLSPAYFSRIFKEETGQTFKFYLNQVRIDKSKELLKDDTLQLIDIVGQVGFEDQSYFTRVFKKHAGISPGMYRQTRGRVPDSRYGTFED